MNFLKIIEIKAYIKRFIRDFRLSYFDQPIKSFIRHNKKVWENSCTNDEKREVLFELTEMQPNIIAYSYLANVLAEKFDARIKGYSFGENLRIGLPLKKIFKSFGVTVFSYRLNKDQRIELEELFDDVYSKLNSKGDVFNLTISGVWFGDLLYDYHLRTYNVPTVKINENKFKKSLKKALYQFIYWRDYFKDHDVKAINISHCCYLVAIPMRIAVYHGIPAYQINAPGCYCMDSKKLWAYTDFYDYPIQFSKLPQNIQQKGLETAKERINKRFSGEVGIDMAYSKKSAYTRIKKDRVLSNTGKFKILIAAHCFFDSPNGLGPNLFIDFYEWFIFLGNISEKTDYEWYVKTHPDFLPGNIPILEGLIKRFPKFKLIPSDTSHHQIIKEGLDCALTTYGTIGWEYAALGKLVVNASLSNPHIAYSFNIHPKSIDEYEKILLNLPEQKLDIDINEVYEYYFMMLRNNNMSNWLFCDFDAFIENVGGYKNQFTSISYKEFLVEFSKDNHSERVQLLNNFIDSKDYCLQKKHYSI